MAIFLQPLNWVPLQKVAEINKQFETTGSQNIATLLKYGLVVIFFLKSNSTQKLYPNWGIQKKPKILFPLVLDWLNLLWWFLNFAAPTVEYLQKDFQSAEGFFCGNRDTYLLHANDDNRYVFTFIIIENSCCNAEEQENIYSTLAFWGILRTQKHYEKW